MKEPGAVCTPPHQQVPQLKDSTIRKDETHGTHRPAAGFLRAPNAAGRTGEWRESRGGMNPSAPSLMSLMEGKRSKMLNNKWMMGGFHSRAGVSPAAAAAAASSRRF